MSGRTNRLTNCLGWAAHVSGSAQLSRTALLSALLCGLSSSMPVTLSCIAADHSKCDPVVSTQAHRKLTCFYSPYGNHPVDLRKDGECSLFPGYSSLLLRPVPLPLSGQSSLISQVSLYLSEESYLLPLVSPPPLSGKSSLLSQISPPSPQIHPLPHRRPILPPLGAVLTVYFICV